MNRSFFLFVSFLVMIGCSSAPPVKPEADNVQTSRDEPDADCKEIGPVEGRTATANGTFEVALEDLKRDAAGKGANFVQIKQSGAMGTAVRGTAYLCL